jgi:peptide/bleomycin uptake transporter
VRDKALFRAIRARKSPARAQLMFQSFFPKPKLFFISFALWAAISMFIWYQYGAELGQWFGFAADLPDAEPIVGLRFFWTPSFLWFYIYYAVSTAIFTAFWFWFSPHPWQWWSILGSSFILFTTFIGVQVSVALNNWRRPFFDDVQAALSPNSTVTADRLYGLIFDFFSIATFSIIIAIFSSFYTSHYLFRWRTAMNDYYTSKWEKVRHIEGASQRVQEDTNRFARIMEDLGTRIIDSVLTLVAFMPILLSLSAYVTEMPVVGKIAAPLLTMAILWSLIGTVLLLVAGIKLPGLEFKRQRVEAAYRKELVYGEDHADRAQPATLKELFNNVRINAFRIYGHYLYFNVARYVYLQSDSIFVYVILIPTIIAGKITFGILQQILSAFGQVSNSFQFLVNSWTTIIDLISVYKRLAAFEAAFDDAPLPKIDQEWIEKPQEV